MRKSTSLMPSGSIAAKPAARLQNRFLDEFERVAELLVSNPNLGTTTGDQRRGFPLHGFPYSIIYRAVEGGMRILVVRHQHRDPEYGERRR
jgi:plasmid stabilization system protein ParE